MIDKIISHYKIIEELGRGGMGVVYKAEDTKLRRTVALKFLPPELTRDPDAKQRFLHEARAAAALNHANIVTIHEINEHEGQIFIAMEYVEGRTLKEMISGSVGAYNHTPLPINDVIAIATQIANGLAAAHA
ncbi:MAG: serine/threonine protein kinase, partial [Chrysiogenales bacterium]